MEALIRMKSDGTPAPAAGVKVLKARDAERLVKASEIVAAAQAEAARIREAAEAAYKERFEAGYAEGIEAGRMENAEKMMETVLASVEFIEGIERTVVDVVTQSVRKIVGELDDAERIRRIVGTALTNVRGEQRVTVRVSPKDEPTVAAALAAMTSGSFLTIVADARLPPDSCILESDLGVVDASLATQLKALENAFAAKIRR